MPEALSEQDEALSDFGTHQASRVATLPREQLKCAIIFKIGTRLAQLSQDWRSSEGHEFLDVGLVQTHLTFVMKHLSLHSERFYGTSLAGNRPFTRSERSFGGGI